MCHPCVSGDLAEVYYGANHPMKPHRMCMAHSLILGYGLHEKMEVYVRLSRHTEFWRSRYVHRIARLQPVCNKG